MSLIYKIFFVIVWPFFQIFFPVKTIGRLNVPKDGALICANHQMYSDPVFLSLGLGIKVHPKYMAKMELFKKPVLGWIMKCVGVFGVDRNNADVSTIMTAMRLLKKGNKVAMYPEGTRVKKRDYAHKVKTGAVRIAFASKVPIVPVLLPLKKRLFRWNYVVIGEPYEILPDEGKKLSRDGVYKATEEMIKKIFALKSYLPEKLRKPYEEACI